MISEIVDLIVDASNTFGSLCSYLRMKYKKYETIIEHQPPMEVDKVDRLYSSFPKLKTEVNIYRQQSLYVVIDSCSIKNNKCTLLVVLLNEKCKYVHGFSILQENAVLPDWNIPCYWQV